MICTRRRLPKRSYILTNTLLPVVCVGASQCICVWFAHPKFIEIEEEKEKEGSEFTREEIHFRGF